MRRSERQNIKDQNTKKEKNQTSATWGIFKLVPFCLCRLRHIQSGHESPRRASSRADWPNLKGNKQNR